MTSVRFTDHAAWRTAERHGSSVSLDILAEEIGRAIDAGWHGPTIRADESVEVTIPSGERFVVIVHPEAAVVLTALGRR